MEPNSREQPPPSDRFNLRQTVNLIYLLASAHAACFTVFLRHGFGTHALALHGPLALGVLLVYAALTGDPWMLIYTGLWLITVLVQRLRTVVLVASGGVWHSRYAGAPSFARGLPFVRTDRGARTVEQFVCVVIGLLLLPVSANLGVFVMAGAISLAIVLGIDLEITRNRVRAMRDAAIEQRHLAALYRGETTEY